MSEKLKLKEAFSQAIKNKLGVSQCPGKKLERGGGCQYLQLNKWNYKDRMPLKRQ